MKQCRECQHQVSEQAVACPQCGAPYPAGEKWDGYGFEYKSKATLFGLPLLHISFKYRPKKSRPNRKPGNRVPVPAKGIIVIGQFAFGVVTISQFGIGVFSIGQFTVAGYALAQVGIAYSLVAQFGLYVSEGRGQIVESILGILGLS